MSQQFIRHIEIPPGEAFTLPPALTIEFDYRDGYTERPIEPADFPPYPSAITWA